MIESVKFHRRLRAARKRKRGIERTYAKLIREAREANKPREDIKAIEIAGYNAVIVVEFEIRHLVSRRIFDLAEAYLLPTPEFKLDGGDWEDDRYGFGYALKPEALSALRTAVRKEQRERFEHLIMWTAPVTGIIGALTGLVAVTLAG